MEEEFLIISVTFLDLQAALEYHMSSTVKRHDKSNKTAARGKNSGNVSIKAETLVLVHTQVH